MTFDLLAEAQNDGFKVARKSSSMGGQFNGPCIIPSTCAGAGRDRLRIQPNKGEYGRFACSTCGQSGNGVDWLMLVRGMTKNEALQYVGWKPKDGSTPKFTLPKHALARVPDTHEAPARPWQAMGRAFVERCEDILWSDQGQAALHYLRSRGLKNEIIKFAHLGYNPAVLRQSADKWGFRSHGKLWKGIVIPWFIGDDLWRITIRDEMVAKGEEGRYKQVKGGSNGLYFADTLEYNRPVVLVEGEFDALSVAQECRHDVSVCATGSTQGGHTIRWISALAQRDLVLVAFDAERDKGDKQALWWLERIETAQRLRPLWDDANQMLQDGIDLWKDWIQPCLQSAKVEDTPIAEPMEQEPVHEVCCMCLNEDKETLATFVGPDNCMYCKQHHRMLPDEWHKAEMERMAEAYRTALPGWNVEAFSPSEWKAHKAKQREAPESMEKPQRDFWADLEARHVHRDLRKPVDWTKYGYRRGKDGRWHAPNSPYWTDNGYKRDSRGCWYLPSSKVST